MSDKAPVSKHRLESDAVVLDDHVALIRRGGSHVNS
jgi:hypothetical protein